MQNQPLTSAMVQFELWSLNCWARSETGVWTELEFFELIFDPQVKERPDVGVYVKDLSTFVVNNADDMDRIMTLGNKNSQSCVFYTLAFCPKILHVLCFAISPC